jgi:hypothetical protein
MPFRIEQLLSVTNGKIALGSDGGLSGESAKAITEWEAFRGKSMRRKVIVLEFNELSPSLMSRFISDGQLPNFKKFADESALFVTEAEERPPYLDPWIQWVTVHTGLNFRDHGIEHLNEGHTVREKRVWDIVSDQGDPVLVCGSMNVGEHQGINGAVVPDPWATHVKPSPEELVPYFQFIQRNVLEYTNDRVPLTRADYLKFITFMMSHGLSMETIGSIARQLLAEKRGVDRWKRAVILDKLQFDVFSWYYKQLEPRFSSFFLNSTAHYQHMYWRDMEPALFKVRPSAEASKHESAILFGYQEMDRLLKRFVELADKDTTLVFCTALSQQPYLSYEESGGRHFYRPSNFDNLVTFAGVEPPFTVAPVMAHQFHLYLQSEEAARRAEQQLLALTVNGRQAMAVVRSGVEIFSGCHLYENLTADTQLSIAGSDRRTSFFSLFYKVEGMKSGMHHPDGLLWIREPGRRPSRQSEKVPLSAVAPTLLDLLGIPGTPGMKASLFAQQREPEPALST